MALNLLSCECLVNTSKTRQNEASIVNLFLYLWRYRDFAFSVIFLLFLIFILLHSEGCNCLYTFGVILSNVWRDRLNRGPCTHQIGNYKDILFSDVSLFVVYLLLFGILQDPGVHHLVCPLLLIFIRGNQALHICLLRVDYIDSNCTSFSIESFLKFAVKFVWYVCEQDDGDTLFSFEINQYLLNYSIYSWVYQTIR